MRSQANGQAARRSTGGRRPAESDGLSPAARGERTRRRLAEATLELLGEAERPPTSIEIADRAGVSHRLLFHHFKDLGALHHLAARIQVERVRRQVAPVPRDLPLEQRIERTVHLRARLFQSFGHLGRNALVLTVSHPEVAQGMAEAREVLVAKLEDTFSPELQRAGTRRRERRSAMGAAVSWQLWDHLRREAGLSNAAARRVMARLLRAAVDH